jgi:hypothetical protein
LALRLSEGLGVAARMLAVGMNLRRERWVKDNLPGVTIWVLEVPGIATPECCLTGLQNLGAGFGSLSHDFIDFSGRRYVVTQRVFKVAWMCFSETCVSGETPPWPERKAKPILKLEERYCSVLELAANDFFCGEAQAVAVEGD